ncbi:hypothetical protein [Halobacillus sp. Marseille-Q1614]|uniref:Mu transposase domain-containing protein n=1 Tax=Halobacillus sp. Marseille-Q1614 TaxID=2709134 RepID=UPI00156EE964|nr:hypothetical protein [Halobacillus sp. Marseille-Q1614]
MVKYVRNNFLLPECTILDLDHFNETLWTLAEEDRDRMHYEKDILQAYLHAEHKDEWLMIPVKSFDCVRHETLTADKYGMVSVDQKQYSTSPRFAKQKVNVQITYNSVVILNDHNEVIVKHNRLYGIKRKSMIWQPYLDLLSRRPMAIKYSNLYEQFPPVWTKYLNRCTEHEQKESLQLLGKLLKNNDFELLNQALELAMKHGHPKADQIKHCFYSIIQGDSNYQTITPTMKVPKVPAATRGLSHYDSLMENGGGMK